MADLAIVYTNEKGLHCSSIRAMLNQAAVNDLLGESLTLEFNLQDVTDTIEV